MYALALRELSKNYGDYCALDRLSLALRPGEIYCLLGHNGAGKSTTVHLILNFISPDHGEVLINNQPVNVKNAQALQRVAYIPENVRLYSELNAFEHLRLFLNLAGQKATLPLMESLLNQVQLPSLAWKRPLGKLSKGMRQKVGIAIALAKKASLLILDEPTSGLDPEASYLFSQQLQQLAQQGVAIFMVTHDLFRVRELGARVGILHRGVLQKELDAQELDASALEALYLSHTGSRVRQ